MRGCQTSKNRKSTVLEQRNLIYIDLDSNGAGFRTTAVENGVEVTHEEKKFSGNEKPCELKVKQKTPARTEAREEEKDDLYPRIFFTFHH